MMAADLLAEIVQIPSLSGDEAAVRDFLGEFLRTQGFEPTIEGRTLCVRRGDGGPHLLLNSHLDTVPAASGWERDPWEGVWRDDRLVGLGANDAKGCVTALLFAFLNAPLDVPGRLTLALTVEEETGGPNGMATWISNAERFDAAIVGEPTSLRVCTAQRGMFLLRATARGETAHVAHALGDNAIERAARDIGRLGAMRFPADPLLGEARAQVTTIQGGHARNAVADRCEFFVDVRTTPNLDHDALIETFRQTLESEVEVHSVRYRPKSTPNDHPLVQAALQYAVSADPIGSNTVSDWSFLGDLPAIKVGPGDTHRSHTPNEFLLRAELEAGVRFYEGVIASYFQAQHAVE